MTEQNECLESEHVKSETTSSGFEMFTVTGFKCLTLNTVLGLSTV